MATNVDKAKAAQEILRFMDGGGTIYEDFSFRGCSANVSRWNDEIADEYYGGGRGDIKAFLRKVIANNSITNAADSTKAGAAQEILNALNAGKTIYEDLTFPGASANVGKWNDTLADEYYNGWKPKLREYLQSVISKNQGGSVDNQTTNPVITPGIGDYNLGGQSNQPDLTWSPVPPNTRIVVQVRAVDRDGYASEWSDPVEHLTAKDDVPPPVPTKLTITPYLGQLRLDWDGKGKP